MPRVLNTCPECGENAKARYCSRRCANTASNRKRQVRSADDVRVRRRERVANAPGLTEYGIRKLTLRWRRQRRQCTYCTNPATTADHVLPLVRGGTNYEGNLTPCCRSCNARKSGLTVIEWRTGLRLPPMSETLDAMGRRRPKRRDKPPVRFAPLTPMLATCSDCGGWTEPGRSACAACKYERHKTRMREKYRATHGIPLDHPRRSKTVGPSPKTLASF